jgi:hypothetical protein
MATEKHEEVGEEAADEENLVNLSISTSASFIKQM